jgi:hypothetical protein
MKTRKLMALKPHKYGTRHLTAGEEYEAPHGYALALVAVKKARYVADKPTAREAYKPPVPSVPRYEPDETPSLDSLRLQATQLGINVDGRWGAHRLQQEIEARRE